jgi:uncharacterized protein
MSYKQSRYMKKLISIIITAVIFKVASAQVADTVTIKSIPHKLFWDNKPVSFFKISNGFSIIAGEKTDMFRDPNVTYNTDNAPKLMFKPDNDFVLTTAIEHNFSNKWDGGAIVLKADSLNWIKFCFEKDYTGKRRVVTVVTKNISDDCNSVEITSNKVFYKIAKADNVVTMYYSLDGKQWLLVRHLQFDTPNGFEAGFLAQSPLGKKCAVKFSNIIYHAKKIKDPYTGE